VHKIVNNFVHEEGATGTLNEALLVVSAHAGDFVWRASGAIAKSTARGGRAVVACLSFGERGESAKAWREGHDLEQIKAIRRAEAEAAARTLGAEIRFFDAGDYPLRSSADLVDALVSLYREVRPTVVLTHSERDPYNGDHPVASQLAVETRVLAQAAGYPADGDVLGTPPVFYFEPHQPEQCGFVPDVLLDITEVYETKQAAMKCLPAQQHMWDYYTDLAVRRGVQLARNAGPNLGLPHTTRAEAFMRLYPQVTDTLA
jgi:4-oxalomesaconate hydratase